MPPEYFRPDEEILKHGDRLPHWEQEAVIQFVTFRLGDSLPVDQVDRFKNQRAVWRLNHPQPWTPAEEAFYHRKFTWRLECWLDRGMGSCWLKSEAVREILTTVLMRFQGERVRHHAWVIMPNHVHLLFTPTNSVPRLIQGWKSKSAYEIGKGPIWQRNYRDTLIRGADHFANAVRYIRNRGKRDCTSMTSPSGKASERKGFHNDIRRVGLRPTSCSLRSSADETVDRRSTLLTQALLRASFVFSASRKWFQLSSPRPFSRRPNKGRQRGATGLWSGCMFAS